MDDVKLPNALHAAIVRSPHAHARIVSIDTGPALEMPGVAAVFTFEDIAATVEPRQIPVRLRAYSDLMKFLQYPAGPRQGALRRRPGGSGAGREPVPC